MTKKAHPQRQPQPHPQQQQQQQETAVSHLHDVVGGQASTWLEETRYHDKNQEGSTLRIATYLALLVVLVVWGRGHYLRNHRRVVPQGEQQEQPVGEVIFVMGIPLFSSTWL